MQGAGGKPAVVTAKTFNCVLVRDFTHTVKKDKGGAPIAANKFSDQIAAAIHASKPGIQVTRNGKAGPGTLTIGGEVTRYVEGNAALRLLIGMGAGSSYFDANVRFSDGADGKELGVIRVDKNSWGLGGGLAAGQTVESFMKEGAQKTAIEAAKLVK
jgi:hypothetical protein